MEIIENTNGNYYMTGGDRIKEAMNNEFKMPDITDRSYILIATSDHSIFNDEVNCYLNILEDYRKEIQLLEKKLIELQYAKHPRFSL